MQSPLPLRSNPSSDFGGHGGRHRGRGFRATNLVLPLVKVSFVVLLCGSSYLAGSLIGGNSLDTHAPHGVGMLVNGGLDGAPSKEECQQAKRRWVDLQVTSEVERREKENLPPKDDGASPGKRKREERRRFPKTTGNYASGMARVKKDDLNSFFDFGNPLDKGKGTGEEDAIIIYQNKKAFPSSESLSHSIEYEDGNGIPILDPKTATENCDAMNVVFTANPGHTRQCMAIIGNFESYHIQRWMRVDTVKSTPIKPELPLSLVSRGYASRGKANFYAPPFDGKYSPVRRHWEMFKTFLQNVDRVLGELTPLLEKVARDNTVVVMTCNRGQSALLMNFACSARRRGFDLGQILVFPTDMETKELAEGLGLTTYFDEENMGPLPSGEARRYGDRNFKAMMYAKVLCVLYPLMLNYDVLFQDADLVWLNDPVPFFHDEDLKKWDVLFQHDGSNSVRYAPYSANSGFYYVRANKRSQYLFVSLLYHSDLIITWDSHQQVLVQLLAEHSSLFGLNVKVYERDTEMFPGGYHFHRQKSFMKKFIKRETESLIFHMSWTENKDNKLLFLRQLGEWYLQDSCIGKSFSEIAVARSASGEPAPIHEQCCAAEPIFSCHFKDKPSRLPCKNSPSIDKGQRSFW